MQLFLRMSYLRDRQLSPRVRVFIDWLSREFAARLAKAP